MAAFLTFVNIIFGETLRDIKRGLETLEQPLAKHKSIPFRGYVTVIL